MTSPDTSDVRAWARSNGYDVADRGRLPAEVTDAYLAAHPGGSGRTSATKTKPAAKKKATARKPSAAKKATSKKAVASPAKKAEISSPPAAARPAPAPAAEPAAKPDPAPKPSVVSDDRRLVALGEQIAALSKRVEALESASGSNGKNGAKASRFRRSR